MNRPSGDQTGDQSIAASFVTGTRRAAGRRDGVDVALAAGVAPVDDALARWRPRRLHGVAVDELPRRAAGGVDDVQRAVALARRRIDDLLGRERDLLAVRRPRGIEADVGDAPDRFAGRAGDEDAADVVRLVKRDQRSVGREGRAAFVALRIVDDRRRVPAADALRVDVPAAVHADRVGDGAAVRRERRRRFLAGRFGDPRERVPARFRTRGRSPSSSHDAAAAATRPAPRPPTAATAARARRDRGRTRPRRLPTTTWTPSTASRARTRDRWPTGSAAPATSRDSAGRCGRGRGDGQPRRVEIRRILREDRRHRVGGGFALERALAAEHLVEHGAEREHVGAMIDRQAAHLLRRHVAERAEHRAGAGRDAAPRVMSCRRRCRSTWRGRSRES